LITASNNGGYEKYGEFETPRLKGGFLPFSTLLTLAYNFKNEHRHRRGVGVSTLRNKWVNVHSFTDTVSTRMSKMMTMSEKREQEQELLTDIIIDKLEEAGMTIGDVELGKEGGPTGN
jgi:hypothetical protein